MSETCDIYIYKKTNEFYILNKCSRSLSGFLLTVTDSNGDVGGIQISFKNTPEELKDILPDETEFYKIKKNMYRHIAIFTRTDEDILNGVRTFGDMAEKYFAEKHIENPLIFRQDFWRDEKIHAEIMKIDFFSEQAINNEPYYIELDKEGE